MMMKHSPDNPIARLRGAVVAAATLGLLAACASPPARAPVEDRVVRPATDPASAPAAASDAPKALPGAENAGKPGYYSVKPGDTLMRVGLETGQNWRDIARWNNVDNPNVLEVGQVLRVAPPGADASATAARPVPPTRVEARPLDGSVPPQGAATVPPSTTNPAAAAAATATAPAATAATPSASAAAVPRDEEVAWAWPTTANVVMPFDEQRSKGLVFTGKAGEPVLAAGDGRVIYVGSGVRGYGNLVIVKHNNTYLTAYAHNQTLLVKEDQVVRRGQKIAEMGSSDADRVQLHFEIRKLGKPVDPARLLPPR
jgi:lipoprotein NlpD